PRPTRQVPPQRTARVDRRIDGAAPAVAGDRQADRRERAGHSGALDMMRPWLQPRRDAAHLRLHKSRESVRVVDPYGASAGTANVTLGLAFSILLSLAGRLAAW